MLKEQLLVFCEDNEFLDEYIKLIASNIKTKRKRFVTQTHHIVPKCVGGKNNKKNLVNLKYSDHILAHYYLCLCCKDKFKYVLECAVNYMTKEPIYSKEDKGFLKKLEHYDEIYTDYKRRLSIKLKGKPGHNKGKKRPKEECEKISKTMKGMKGHPCYDYVKEKLRKANLGKRYSEKTKKKKSLSLKNYYTKHRKLPTRYVSVIQLSLDDRKIKEYSSAAEAARELGIDSSGIIKCCKGKRKTVKGYKWKYK